MPRPPITHPPIVAPWQRLLLNKCQEEFEKENVVKTQLEALGEDTPKEEKELIRMRAKKRMLGNIRFIGELYKQKMLTEKIMHECLIKLLGDIEKPDEARAARRPPPPAAARPRAEGTRLTARRADGAATAHGPSPSPPSAPPAPLRRRLRPLLRPALARRTRSSACAS